jgi:hypothetical protein
MAAEKHTSLLRYGNNCGRKKILVQATIVEGFKSFWSKFAQNVCKLAYCKFIEKAI